jgi:ribosomal protein S9
MQQAIPDLLQRRCANQPGRERAGVVWKRPQEVRQWAADHHEGRRDEHQQLVPRHMNREDGITIITAAAVRGGGGMGQNAADREGVVTALLVAGFVLSRRLSS